MNVREVMTPNPRTCQPNSTIQDAALIMRDEDTGAVPVVEGGRVIGMVTDRDIVVRAVADGGEIERVTARQVMSASVLYCYESDNVAAVLRNMGENQVRRLPVVDRDKRLVGVVSLGDLSRAAHEKASGSALREISEKPVETPPGPRTRRSREDAQHSRV